MLDFGFTKMMVVGAVALIVLGPEKLPQVARTVGALWGKAQRYIFDLKAELAQQIEAAELKNIKREIHEQTALLKEDLSAELIGTKEQIASSFYLDEESGEIKQTLSEVKPHYPEIGFQSFSMHGISLRKLKWRTKQAQPLWYRRASQSNYRVMTQAKRMARKKTKYISINK